jgi:site-specific recombinase XerD
MDYPIKFIIRDDRVNSKGKCPIYLRYTLKRKFINTPVKYSISPQFWDKEDGRPTRNYPDYKGLRTVLKDFEDVVVENLNQYKDQNGVFPDVEHFKNVISGTSVQIQQGGVKSLDDYFKEYVEYRKRDDASESTLKIYSYTWDKWKGFRESKGRSYDYQDLNFNLLNEFRIYLKNQGLQLNTVSKYIKTIKSFLSYLSLHKELPVPASYKKVSVEKEEPEIEVLTQEELEVLKRECFFTRSEEHQISEYSLNDREKLIGQMMVFMCHTGLSYVDFDNFKLCHLIFLKESKNIKGLQLQMTRQKLKSVHPCKIPILDVTIDLIMDKLGIPHIFTESNKNEATALQTKINMLESFIENQIQKGELTINSRVFPKVISQVFNQEIKGVLKKIHIDTSVMVNTIIRGERVEKAVPKYSIISSRTGRRTFVTRNIENGINPLVLKDMTGHIKLQTMVRYNKNSPSFIQRELNEKTPGQTGHVKIGRIEDSNDIGNLEQNGGGDKKKR